MQEYITSIFKYTKIDMIKQPASKKETMDLRVTCLFILPDYLSVQTVLLLVFPVSRTVFPWYQNGWPMSGW